MVPQPTSVLPRLWHEAPDYERHLRKAVAKFPSWSDLEAEADALRAAVRADEPFDRVRAIKEEIAAAHFPGPLSAVSPNNFGVFSLLPSVAEVIGRYRHLTSRALKDFPEENRRKLVAATLNAFYQSMMFRRSGRRVYVVDPATFELLARTDLPKMPASHLVFPQESFYLLLPTGMFEVSTEGATYQIRGVTVSVDATGPAPDEERTVRLWIDGYPTPAPGEKVRPSGGADVALDATFQLRPDQALLDVLKHEIDERASDTGSLALDSITKVVAGLCLYMMSEHPHLEPIPPASRIAVENIKNTAKRRKAEQQNDRVSRLGYIRVGDPATAAAANTATTEPGAEGEESPAGRWRLDHQVWVRGHWRQQAFGPGLKEHRLVWIRPHVKGPDMAESLAIRAARVQPARVKDPGADARATTNSTTPALT